MTFQTMAVEETNFIGTHMISTGKFTSIGNDSKTADKETSF